MLYDMHLGRAAMDDIEMIEQSMIALRRRQRRRTLARLGVEVIDPGSEPHGLQRGDRC